jgi:hypothetical protein
VAPPYRKAENINFFIEKPHIANVRRQIPADERENHSSLFGATSFLVILASPRKEFATARAGAAVLL